MDKRFIMMIVIGIAGWLVMPGGALAGPTWDLDYSGYVKTEVWVRNNLNGQRQSLSSFKNTLDLELEYTLSDNLAVFFHPRYFYDAAYSIRTGAAFDKSQEIMGDTYKTEWLRDAYLDYTSDQLDVRLGKQQVVWGQADGFPILDRVHPYDLTSHWLPDFADIRIPLWMLKLEYSPKLDSTLQFLFIPDAEASRAAPANAPFAYRAVNAFDTFKNLIETFGGSVTTDTYKPAQSFDSSRFGLRWRSFVKDVEYTLNWLYGASTSAYTYGEGLANITGVVPGTSTPVGDYTYSRKQKLMHIIGFSFNKTFLDPGPLQGLTVRGEFGFLHNEPTYYGTPGSRQMTEKTDKYAYVLGFDKNLFTNWLFSVQFIQYIHNEFTRANSSGTLYKVLDNYTYGVMDKVENIVTCKISTDFMHERIKPELLVIYQDDGDGRFALKTGFEAFDDLWITLGYHHFWGNMWGSNGQFRNNDQIVTEVKYTF